MKRRQFIKTTALGTAVLSAPLSSKYLFASPDSSPNVVVVSNGEPHSLVQTALRQLGGISRFIEKNDVVVIKPNMGWDRKPELAANTNPDVIAELVRQCLDAGAKKVKVFDRTCNNPLRCYRNSEIEARAKEAGAEVTQIRKNKYEEITTNGKIIRKWPIYKEYLEADKVINVPIAKHHGLSRVTLGLKNLMGVMGGNRGSLHKQFSQKMADINKNILPTLTVIDAYRMLTANGPQGGNPDHVKQTHTLIASPCTVSADYVALELFDLTLDEVDHIKVANQEGLAKFNLDKLNISRVKI